MKVEWIVMIEKLAIVKLIIPFLLIAHHLTRVDSFEILRILTRLIFSGNTRYRGAVIFMRLLVLERRKSLLLWASCNKVAVEESVAGTGFTYIRIYFNSLVHLIIINQKSSFFRQLTDLLSCQRELKLLGSSVDCYSRKHAVNSMARVFCLQQKG